MSFVPVAPPQPPSPRAQELGRRLGEVVEKFRREHPDLTGTEIRQAMGLATGGMGAKSVALLVALALGLLAAGLLAALFLRRM